MATEAMAEATPATVYSGSPEAAPSSEQQVTLGSVSSMLPPTLKLALPAPSAAAMMATSAAMMAMMMARIFHHGSAKGSSPCTPAKGGFGAHTMVSPVGTTGPPPGGQMHSLPSGPVCPQRLPGRWPFRPDTVSVPSCTVQV